MKPKARTATALYIALIFFCASAIIGSVIRGTMSLSRRNDISTEHCLHAVSGLREELNNRVRTEAIQLGRLERDATAWQSWIEHWRKEKRDVQRRCGSAVPDFLRDLDAIEADSVSGIELLLKTRGGAQRRFEERFISWQSANPAKP